MTLLMNHIDSTRRPGLGNKAPYELINERDEDMWALFALLKIDLIPPDEVQKRNAARKTRTPSFSIILDPH